MSEMINDRLNDLDDLRSLGEEDGDDLHGLADESSDADNIENEVDTSPVEETIVATETTLAEDSLDDLRGLADESSDAGSIENEVDTSPVEETIVTTETMAEKDTVSEEKPVLAVETTPGEKASSVESISSESDDVEKVNLAPAPIATVEKETTPATSTPETGKASSVATTDKDTDAASPVAASMTSGGEVIFNPTISLRIFLFLRHYFIIFFDIVLTGVAIAIEHLMAVEWGWIFGKIASVLKIAHGIIANRLPKKVRIGLYTIIPILCFGIPSGFGIYTLFSGNDNPAIVAFAQTVNINQNNTTIANSGIIAMLFTPTVQQWASDIERWTNGTNISPDMFALVMQLESCGNPSVTGGLFGVREDSASNPDAEATIAIEKLQSAVSLSNGDLGMALAIYGDGEQVLTDDFGLWTLHARDMYFIGHTVYTEAQAGHTSSADLNSWLQNTGNIMCTEAQIALNG